MSIRPSRLASLARPAAPRCASSLPHRAPAGVVALLVAVALGAACAAPPVAPAPPAAEAHVPSASVASLPSSLDVAAADDTVPAPPDSTGGSDSMPWWRR